MFEQVLVTVEGQSDTVNPTATGLLLLLLLLLLLRGEVARLAQVGQAAVRGVGEAGHAGDLLVDVVHILSHQGPNLWQSIDVSTLSKSFMDV